MEPNETPVTPTSETQATANENTTEASAPSTASERRKQRRKRREDRRANDGRVSPWEEVWQLSVALHSVLEDGRVTADEAVYISAKAARVAKLIIDLAKKGD